MIRIGCTYKLYGRKSDGFRTMQLALQCRYNSTSEEKLKKLSSNERRLSKTGNSKRGLGKVKSPWVKLDRSDSILNRTNAPNRRGDSQDIPRQASDASLPDSGGNIDRLRNAFMQSFSAHRERGQANSLKNQRHQEKQRPNSSDNSNTESRLDQLLRLSKMKSNDRRMNGFRDRNNFNNQNRDNRAPRKAMPVASDAQVLQQELMRENTLSKNQNKQTNTKESLDKKLLLPNRPISIIQLSTITRESKEKILKVLNDIGERPSRNAVIDDYQVDVDIAELVALELGFDPEREKRSKCSAEDAEKRMLRQGADASAFDEEAYENLPPRPAVVCICGHVDHGKTTLMDALRRKAAESMQTTQSHRKKKDKKGKKKKDGDSFQAVAGTEAGGITQVVSAFQIRMPDVSGSANSDIDTVTFLDTPGHAAFKSMRKSGSNGADVLVLVIAADDGVSPQTVEIINMYKEIARGQPGSITLMIAMTKIDKPGIDIEQSMRRIENQLMEHEIFTERMTSSDCEFGGVQMVPLSGLTGDGVDDLVEGLILQSEVMDLRACKESRAEGLIIDAKVETGLGVVVDCIIRWGKLEVGDYVHSGVHGGKVRILNDVNNKPVKRASPSQPVRLVGFKSLPKAGDAILCVQSEEISKEIIARREALAATNDSTNTYRVDDSNAKLDVQISGGASKKGFMANNILKKYNRHDEAQDDCNEDDDQIRIPVILKADADGTLAALRDSILAIQEQSSLNLLIDPIEISVGHVTPSDVNMAMDSGASIFCFNLKGSKDKAAMSLASNNHVDIRSNNVIYRLLEDAKDVFSGFCPPTPVEKIHGKALVQAVFDINNNKDAERVAGLKVTDGKLYLKNVAAESGTLDCMYRIKKKGKEVKAEGLIAKSLRRVKDEVTDVRLGDECGLNLEGFKDVEEGDIVECYSVEMKRKFV